MNRTIRAALIGTGATIALIAASCAPAFADSTTPTPAPTSSAHAPRTLAEIQASAKEKTGKRIDSLTKAIAKVTAAKGFSSSDRSTVLATLNADLAGMNTVEAKFQADTTASAAAADYKTIYTTYRVYAVALPQARIAGASDRMTSLTIPRLTKAQSALSAKLSGSSKSTPALQADLTDMSAQLTTATNDLDGLSAKALAVTPSDFNANHDVMSSLRASAKSAIAALKKAAQDAKAVRAALKN